jgi:type IV secretion system protein VirB4
VLDHLASLLDGTSGSQLPILGHARDGVALLSGGGVFALAEVFGTSWETCDPKDVFARFIRLNQTYKQIAHEDVTLSVYQVRGTASPIVYPTGGFESAFSSALDDAYRAALFGRTLYENRTYICVQIRPSRPMGETLGSYWETKRGDVDTADERRIQRLEDLMALLMSELSIYRPRRLGVRVTRYAVFSELAEALVHAMTGHWRSIGLTTGRMSEAMFTEQIVFDRESIKFVAPGQVWHAAMFGMKHFPSWTYPGMFGRLLSAPYTCTVFQSFRFVATQTAQDIMRRKRYKMLTAEDPAESQAHDLRIAADGLGSAAYAFGEYSFSLLAFATDEQALQDVATAAWGNLADSGMVVSRESLGLQAAFFSMVPGNASLFPRPGYISSLNFAAMAPLHAYATGRRQGYWGEPAAIFRTVSGEPFFYHFQRRDVGNTFVSGMVGSGKSTLIGFLVAQAGRLGATVVCWDKDRGLKMLCHALGGVYAELRNPTGLAPLKRLTSSAEDIQFLTELIRGCIMADGGIGLTPEEERRLRLGLNVIMTLPAAARHLADLREFLGVDGAGAGARLEKWCWGHEYGWVIDNPDDVISLDAPVIGFDQTFILDNAMARGPVMATLYHYVEGLIDGRRLLFVIDEFWKSLLDDSFRALVADKLRTLRKRNSPVILATQSPRDALKSDIAHVIRDQCPSKFYFANEDAAWADYGNDKDNPGMGLTQTEFRLVRTLAPGSGEFLLKQGPDSVRAQLPLDGMDDFIAILSGRETTTRLFDRVRQQDLDADIGTVLAEFHDARRKEMAQ